MTRSPASTCVLLVALFTAPAAPHASSRSAVSARRVARAAWARARPLAASHERGPGHDVPKKLLLQCSIQAQLSYCNEFKNELMGRWLESFLGHEHLRATRTGDMTSTIKFQGLEGLRCDWQDYLRTMLSSGPQEYTVRYCVGTPDLMPRQRSEASSTATASGEEAPWAAASASRRNNPYLKDQGPKYKEYTETIEPRRVARGLMQIRSQLSEEWLHDMPIIAADGAAMREWLCGEEETKRRQSTGEVGPEVCAVEPTGPRGGVTGADEAASTAARGSMGEAPASKDAEAELDAPAPDRQGRAPLPPPIATTFAEAARSWSGSSTPFRALNYDMIQRALMREATLRALRELERDGTGKGTHEWLRERFTHWRPLLEMPQRRFEGAHFLLELLSEPPAMRTGAGGDLELFDPSHAVDEVLAQRQAVCEAWSAVLSATGDEHAELLREDLQMQLNAPAHGKE